MMKQWRYIRYIEHDVENLRQLWVCVGISKEEATRRLLNNGDIVKRAIRDRQP